MQAERFFFFQRGKDIEHSNLLQLRMTSFDEGCSRLFLFSSKDIVKEEYKMTKYIFVTGGVVSSLGKGIVAASLGRLLKNRGLQVTIQKFDPYINIDPGTMSPYQHGEVFVTDDGAEADLDLGHYERFIDINLGKHSTVTSGRVYQSVLQKERRGDYNGGTVQVIPHITNEIKDRIQRAGRETSADVVITEVGGTVGDIEGLPFLEAIRQMKRDLGSNNVMYVHCTLLPYIKAAGELKTKPTQHSVKELRSLGIQPNILVVRTEQAMPQDMKEKLALFCDVRPHEIIESLDAEHLYEVPLNLHAQDFDDIVLDHFGIQAPEADMTEWKELVNKVKNLQNKTRIALVGKYVELQDAYISVVEALKHAGYVYNSDIEVDWINAEHVNEDNVKELLKDVDGILVPGGFGDRGVEGKILATQYARENNVPFLGICLGMQLATIEFARNVLGLNGAHSTELDKDTPYPIIDFLPDQHDGVDIGGTLRLGLYPCKLKDGSRAMGAYNDELVYERHRHRYEFNNEYREAMEAAGLVFSGTSPDNKLVEIIELPEKKFFVACQFHPELVSRPNRPQPLFREFVGAAFQNQ